MASVQLWLGRAASETFSQTHSRVLRFGHARSCCLAVDESGARGSMREAVLHEDDLK